jgi:hypothetical protein
MEIRTRSGRLIKAPERFSPQEKCTDDFNDSEYDSDEDASYDEETDSESGSDSDSDSDADEHGNLKDFVCYDSEEES